MMDDAADERWRFVVRLLIRHPTLDPATVSETLKLEPKVCHLVGDQRKMPAGNPLPGKYRESLWGWSKRVDGDREFFGEVEKLTKQLMQHSAFLLGISNTGGQIDIIVHLPGDANIGSALSADAIRVKTH